MFRLAYLYRGHRVKRLVEVPVARGGDDDEFVEVLLTDFTEVFGGKAETSHEAATNSQGLPSLELAVVETVHVDVRLFAGVLRYC